MSGREKTYVRSLHPILMLLMLLAGALVFAGVAAASLPAKGSAGALPQGKGQASGTAKTAPNVLCGSLSFAPPITYTTGNIPRSMTTGYLNGDAFLDLVVTNYSSNNVSVLLGNGNGTFQPSANYTAGSNPVTPAIGDFNEDNIPDLAVSNYNSSNVSILLGNGNGTFQSTNNFPANIGPYGLTVGNFNADTHLDIAVSNVNFGNINVLLGNGNGTFQAPVPYTAGSRPQVVSAGDFNEDTHVDLVTPNYNASSISLLLGNGNGTFQQPVSTTVQAGPDYLTVANLNGDSHLDVLVTHYSTNNVSVLLGNGNGTFQTPVVYPTGGSNPLFVSVGDFNGDGIPDLATANYGSDSNTVGILLGNGDGTFQPVVTFLVGDSARPIAVLAGDYNGDGRLDMSTANESGYVSVFISTCGAATPTPTIAASTSTRTQTATATSTIAATNTATRTPTVVATSTATLAATGTATISATRTNVATQTATSTTAPTNTAQTTSTVVSTGTATPVGATSTVAATNTVAPSATSTTVPPTACPIQFQDVAADNTFYSYVRCLACRGILGGYQCGGEGEPCGITNNPYFRPGVQISRGQIAKIVAQSASLNDDPGTQIYEDVPTASPFFAYIQRLSNKGYIGGYPCGELATETCVTPGNRPYFRPSSDATRGQLSKIVSNAAGFTEDVIGQYFTDVPSGSPFYPYIQRLTASGVLGGYPCGGDGEPCDAQSRPYFRPNAEVTRGQASKIVANTFFPNCRTSAHTK